jgi:hypothetical protein
MHYIKVNHLHHVSKAVWLMSHNSNILVERYDHHLLRPFSRIVVLDALALAHYAALDCFRCTQNKFKKIIDYFCIFNSY